MRQFLREFREFRMGWWGNKPPVHRFLVLLGLLITIGLVSIGILIDSNLLPLKRALPSLNPFIWDLAKGAILGTVTIAILDDVRSWGVAWRSLKANSASVADAANNLIETLLSGLGLQNSIFELGGLRHTAVRAARVESWANILNSAYYDFRNARIFDELPSVQNPYESWDSFRSLLKSKGAQIPSSYQMNEKFPDFSVEAFTKELTKATLRLKDSLESIRQDTSTGVSSRISDLLIELTAFPDAAGSFTAQVRQLVLDEKPQANDSSANTAHSIRYTMYLLASVLEGLAYEGTPDDPTPSARRTS